MNRDKFFKMLDRVSIHPHQEKILMHMALMATHKGYCAQTTESLMRMTELTRNEVMCSMRRLCKKRILIQHFLDISRGVSKLYYKINTSHQAKGVKHVD